MQNIEQKQHITEELWNALSDHTIQHQEYMKILEHTCGCTWCAEQLAQIMSEEEAMARPPAYLKEQILEQTARLDVRAHMSVKKRSKQLRLFMYSMKVGLAVVVSSLLLVVSVNIQRLGMGAAPDDAAQQAQRQQEVSRRLQEADEKAGDGMAERLNRASWDVTDKMSQLSNYLLDIIY